MSTQSKVEFLKWVRARHPKLYSDAMNRAGGNLGALSDTISKVFDTVTKTVATLGTAYVSGRAALDLAKANIKRAKQGLLPADSLEEANWPGGVAPMGGIPPWVLYAGVGLIAFMLLKR